MLSKKLFRFHMFYALNNTHHYRMTQSDAKENLNNYNDKTGNSKSTELMKTVDDERSLTTDELYKRSIEREEKMIFSGVTEWLRTRKRGTPYISSALQKRWDVSWSGFKRKIRSLTELNEIYKQRFLPKRHGILGPDLATAHFIVFRKGKVKFNHSGNDWVVDYDNLPLKHNPNYRLVIVDASKCNLRYEGIDNFSMLEYLEELNLSDNDHLDDWTCDKIARQFRDSTALTVLDLSNNFRITQRGIEALYKIKSLKTLIIKGTKAAEYEHLELLTVLFTDILPECEIIT